MDYPTSPVDVANTIDAPATSTTKWEIYIHYDGGWMYNGEYDTAAIAAQNGVEQVTEYPGETVAFIVQQSGMGEPAG